MTHPSLGGVVQRPAGRSKICRSAKGSTNPPRTMERVKRKKNHNHFSLTHVERVNHRECPGIGLRSRRLPRGEETRIRGDFSRGLAALAGKHRTHNTVVLLLEHPLGNGIKIRSGLKSGAAAELTWLPLSFLPGVFRGVTSSPGERWFYLRPVRTGPAWKTTGATHPAEGSSGQQRWEEWSPRRGCWGCHCHELGGTGARRAAKGVSAPRPPRGGCCGQPQPRSAATAPAGAPGASSRLSRSPSARPGDANLFIAAR